ncbi:MAG: hypothetical protein WCG61_04720 [Chlorobium sp.]
MKMPGPTFQNACNTIVALVCIGFVALLYYKAYEKPEPFSVWYEKLLRAKASSRPALIREPVPEKVKPGPGDPSEQDKLYWAKNERENKLYWPQLEKNKTHADRTIKIHNSLTELHFSIFGKYTSQKSSEYTHDYFTPSHFEYRFGNTKRVMRMNLKNKMFLGTINKELPIIEFIDINFDGYLDLRIFDNAGNVMWWYQTFLFDPTQKKFIYNAQLSSMPMLTVDSKNKRLYTRWWGGILEQIAARFVINRNVLYLERLAVTEQGIQLEDGRFLTSGKEYKRLLKSNNNDFRTQMVLYAPRTKSGLVPEYRYFDVNLFYEVSRNFRRISTEGDDVGEMVMRGMPNDEIKRSLWVGGQKQGL